MQSSSQQTNTGLLTGRMLFVWPRGKIDRAWFSRLSRRPAATRKRSGSVLPTRSPKTKTERVCVHYDHMCVCTCVVGRYVRHLDSTIHAIHIKTKVCQLVEAMMLRRDDLTFRQEMKFRNKLVEYLTDWIMGNSHQLNIQGQGDVFTMSRYLSVRHSEHWTLVITR